MRRRYELAIACVLVTAVVASGMVPAPEPEPEPELELEQSAVNPVWRRITEEIASAENALLADDDFDGVAAQIFCPNSTLIPFLGTSYFLNTRDEKAAYLQSRKAAGGSAAVVQSQTMQLAVIATPGTDDRLLLQLSSATLAYADGTDEQLFYYHLNSQCDEANDWKILADVWQIVSNSSTEVVAGLSEEPLSSEVIMDADDVNFDLISAKRDAIHELLTEQDFDTVVEDYYCPSVCARCGAVYLPATGANSFVGPEFIGAELASRYAAGDASMETVGVTSLIKASPSGSATRELIFEVGIDGSQGSEKYYHAMWAQCDDSGEWKIQVEIEQITFYPIDESPSPEPAPEASD